MKHGTLMQGMDMRGEVIIRLPEDPVRRARTAGQFMEAWTLMLCKLEELERHGVNLQEMRQRAARAREVRSERAAARRAAREADRAVVEAHLGAAANSEHPPNG